MKVISGGQTGVDRTALEVARELGIETGGWAPKGWRTDAGPDHSLRDFGLREADDWRYPQRTRWNVRDADATVIFGESSPGTNLTVRYCGQLQKPCLTNPMIAELIAFVRTRGIETLNVAGNRCSTNPTIVAEVRAVLKPALEAIQVLRKELP